MTEVAIKPVLRLALIPDALSGKVWELNGLFGLPVLFSDKLWLRISGGGLLIGVHGFTCFTGCVATHDGRIAISIATNCARLTHSPEDRKLEIFLRVLCAASSHCVTGESLALFDGLGGELASFEARLPA